MPTITAFVAAFDATALNCKESYLAGGNKVIKLPQANQPKSPQLKYLTKHKVYVFYKNHIWFFLSVFKKKKNQTHCTLLTFFCCFPVSLGKSSAVASWQSGVCLLFKLIKIFSDLLSIGAVQICTSTQ